MKPLAEKLPINKRDLLLQDTGQRMMAKPPEPRPEQVKVLKGELLPWNPS